MLCCVGHFFSLTTSLQWSFNDVISCLEAVIENWWNFLRLEFHTLCITWPTDLSDKILGSNFHIRLIFYYKKWLIGGIKWLDNRWWTGNDLIHLMSHLETVGNWWYIWFQASCPARVIICNHQFLKYLKCFIGLFKWTSVAGLRLKPLIII